MVARPRAAAAGLDPDQADRLVVDEGGEQPGRVRPAADAGHGQVGQAALGGQDLGPGLVADDPLELPDHERERVGADHRPDGVVGGADSTQSRSASLMASLRVAVPVATGRTSVPSSRMRTTLRCWRRVSSSPM